MQSPLTPPLPPQPADFGRVCAIIVTLNIGRAIHSCFEAVRAQVDHIVFIDNASTDTTPAELEAIRAQSPDFIDILENHDGNLGRAQNLGILLASDLGFDWVLLLDHDSMPAPGMVQAMCDIYARHPAPARIGLLAPQFIDEASGKRPRFVMPFMGVFFKTLEVDSRPYVDKAQTAISSGSLVSLRVIGEVGLMDEGFYIDYIDKDFCLRLNKAGYNIVAVRDAMLKHCLGDGERKRLMGLKVNTTNHSVDRHYYIYRNRVITWKRYLRSIPSYMLYDLLAVCFDLVRIAAFEQDKRQKLRMAGRGMLDGFKGISGHRP